MKRILILAVIAVFAISMLFVGIGCKEEAAPAEEAAEEAAPAEETAEEAAPAEEDIFSEPSELVFWWYGEEEAPGLINYIKGLCDDYNKIHPNITVTQVHQGMDVLIPNFLAAYEAQSGPDIVCLWGGLNLLEWVWQGAIVPLNDYINEEEFSHWLGRKYSEYDGKIYGSDLGMVSLFTIYYKDHFVDAGLDPDTPPETWDEFLDYSAKLKAAGHDPWAAGFSGGMEMDNFANFMWGYFIDYPGILECVTGDRHFNEPDFVDWWAQIDEYNKAGYYMKGANSIDWIEAMNEWRAGKATFLVAPGATSMTYMDDLGPDKVGYFTFPANSDKRDVVANCWACPHSITSWSENKELAADFLNFFHAPENYPKLLEAEQYHFLPADDRFDFNIIQEPEHAKWFAERTIKGLEADNYNSEFAIPWVIIDNGLIQGGQALILGELDPQGAADNMEQAAIEWREQNPEMLECFKTWAAGW